MLSAAGRGRSTGKCEVATPLLLFYSVQPSNSNGQKYHTVVRKIFRSNGR